MESLLRTIAVQKPITIIKQTKTKTTIQTAIFVHHFATAVAATLISFHMFRKPIILYL